MKIIDLKNEDKEIIRQTASILYESFKNITKSWEYIDLAIDEVYESIGEDKISRVALNEQNEVIGWIGARSMYDGNVWELHPLVVKEEYRGKGIGRSLVKDLEDNVKELGGLTIWLGTDDENNSTSLSNNNLYKNLYEKIVNIKNYKNHPFEFYQKLGFIIVGVMPDANGVGKPDIFMAKSVRK